MKDIRFDLPDPLWDQLKKIKLSGRKEVYRTVNYRVGDRRRMIG